MEKFVTELTDEIKNSAWYKFRYKTSYGDKENPIIHSKIINDTSECGFPKKKFYYFTDGIKVNFRKSLDENIKQEFIDKVTELVKEHEDIIQISYTNHLSLAVPEHIREVKMINNLNSIRSTKKRVERYRKARLKKRIEREKFLFLGKTTPSIKNLLYRNLTTSLLGEYFENSDGEYLITLTDTKAKYVETQKKVISKELYDHLEKHKLIDFLENKETYKKFFFTEEMFNNRKKYFRIYNKEKKE